MLQTMYFAGGCFWGMEHLFQQLDGVKETECGFANGVEEIIPDYKTVCKGGTLYRETVKVVFEDTEVSLRQLLKAFFYVIDPTVENRQAGDIGDQYQTGLYYLNDEQKDIILDYVSVEKTKHDKFMVEIKPLVRYFKAEDYHQNYLNNNPTGYCHIPLVKYQEVNEYIKK